MTLNVILRYLISRFDSAFAHLIEGNNYIDLVSACIY